MSGIVATKIAFLVILLLCSGFLSGSETALLSLGQLDPYRVREKKETWGTRCLRELLERPGRFLLTLLVGNELIVIAVSVLAASITEDLAPVRLPLGAVDPVLGKTLVAVAACFPLLLLGEIAPKSAALRAPRRLARFAAGPLCLFQALVAPFCRALEGLANGAVRLLFGESPAPVPSMEEEALRSLVDRGPEGGALREAEREFIHNLFDFGEARVSEVMTPRTDMFCLQADQSLEEVLRAIEEKPFSRIPVYEADKDDIIGILYCKDLLGIVADGEKKRDWNLRSFLRKPYFIPQTKKASDLFREFRLNRIHLAIVVDEYGGVAGLVTMEDLLEELFGEIMDEYDPEEPKPRRLDENTLIIPARMPIEDFNRFARAALPEDEYDTMGGLVFGLFGKLPSPGAKVSFQGYAFTVEEMEGTRILELRVEKEPKPEGEPKERPPGTEPSGEAEGGKP